MKIANGKIVEATEDELYAYWLKRELDDVIQFADFMQANIHAGCVTTEKEG